MCLVEAKNETTLSSSQFRKTFETTDFSFIHLFLVFIRLILIKVICFAISIVINVKLLDEHNLISIYQIFLNINETIDHTKILNIISVLTLIFLNQNFLNY